MIPKRKNADDEWIPITASAMDENFLDLLHQLDFPPSDEDRLNLRLRFFSKEAAKV